MENLSNPKTENWTMKLFKCLIGEGENTILILCGSKQDIQAMHTSAYNWGAIEESNHPHEIGMSLWGFALEEKSAIRWRADVKLLTLDVTNPLRFDNAGIESPVLKTWSSRQARKWVDSLPETDMRPENNTEMIRNLKKSRSQWMKNGQL